jgi:hypothetical protein
MAPGDSFAIFGPFQELFSSLNSEQAVKPVIGIAGIPVPSSLSACRKVWCYQDGEIWILASKRGARLANFASRDAALAWWTEFCKFRGVDVQQPKMHRPPGPKSRAPCRGRKRSHQIKAEIEGPPSSGLWYLNHRQANSIRIRRCRCGKAAVAGSDSCYSCG